MTVAAVILLGLALPTDAQTTTTTKSPITPYPNGSYPPPAWYDRFDPWNPTVDPAQDPIVCHTAPWARTNPNTPNDDPNAQICPCDYPYHQKQRLCCKPQKNYDIYKAPLYYATAGPSVEAHKSRVDGKMLCPCGYSLNATDNFCYSLKDDKYDDRCPCGTTKNPNNLACYYNNGTTANGIIFPNGTYTEQWGECLPSIIGIYWFRSWPLDNEKYNYINICPCEYVYNKKNNRCCKLKSARSPFFYDAAGENGDVYITTDGQRLCPCGYYEDDQDGKCRSRKTRKYEDRCACGWRKDPYKLACNTGDDSNNTYFQPY
jgi:hypothetical protein